MVDFRVYRLAFAPALLALVALMFSLQGQPEALEPAVPPASFEAGRAAATARQIVAMSPERPPGSEADEATADLVAERFTEIGAGSVAEQRIDASFDGEEISARNVVLTLAGDSPATVVVLAGRDATTAAASTQSAAATAALIELAAALGVSSHAKTFVLASTSAASAGAAGAQGLIDGLPDPEEVDAVVVLSQLGLAEPRPPFVVDSSTGTLQTAVQLVATAETAIEEQLRLEAERPGVVRQLSRLAFPSGLGQQAPLIARGFDAVNLSAAGERPLESEGADPEGISPRVLGGFGRAASSVVQAIDVAEGPLEQGPQPYLVVGDNLVPGWALALLALALLLPALVAAVDATAWALRRSHGMPAALAWAAARAVPAVVALIALYVLALIGPVPRPAFPFDPGHHGIDTGAVVAIVLIALAAVGGWVLAARTLGPISAPRAATVAALGASSVAAALLAWLVNPYLGLLLAPVAHAWLALAAGARPVLVAGAVAAALLPLALALGEVAAALELGIEAPWTFMVMVADGQISFGIALALCLLAGSLAGTVVASRLDPRSD